MTTTDQVGQGKRGGGWGGRGGEIHNNSKTTGCIDRHSYSIRAFQERKTTDTTIHSIANGDRRLCKRVAGMTVVMVLVEETCSKPGHRGVVIQSKTRTFVACDARKKSTLPVGSGKRTA